MDSLPFDNMVDLYDQTRTVDNRCLTSTIDLKCERFPPSSYQKLFEPAIGSGRIAFPLADRGYQIVGVDISEAMLSQLNKRVRDNTLPCQQIDATVGDVTELKFEDATFDISVVVHLFYFIRDWQRAVREILRVTRPDGPVVLMHTGMGEEIPFLNERYKELCGQQGCAIESVGSASTREVIDYAGSLGYLTEIIRDRWQWMSRVRLDQAISYMKRRAYSFTTFAPDQVHKEAMATIKSQCVDEYGDLSKEIEISNQVYLAILQREQGA